MVGINYVQFDEYMLVSFSYKFRYFIKEDANNLEKGYT